MRIKIYLQITLAILKLNGNSAILSPTDAKLPTPLEDLPVGL